MRKVFAFFMTIVMCFMCITSAFAVDFNNIADELALENNYEHFTCNLGGAMTRMVTRTEDSIAQAKLFVEELDLPSKGYEYIEEACLNELEAYSNQGAILESYTVLVPKARDTQSYFGTYGTHDFYYGYTSRADVRYDIQSGTKGENLNMWEQWASAAVDIILTFVETTVASYTWSAFSTVSGITDLGDVHNEAYFHFVTRYNNLKTRTIYREDNGVMVPCYQDQIGDVDIESYFCPVDIDDGNAEQLQPFGYSGTQCCSTAFTKNQILYAANLQANHNSTISYIFRPGSLIQSWL